ncbi:IclR family transcriptional regulator [Haloarchaeobius sp. DFWS5]|uniref:IclR family transcriptional regulator n=1 Tax=Haloarchaeobius sp. DFWS5 TaxID=3446114 RepID=UPI003EC04CDD
MTEPKHPVRSVDRALDVLEVLQELNGATVSEVAARVDIGKSAVHNQLRTLANRDYVVQEGDQYDIGLAFLGLGAYARNRTRIYQTARPEVEKLAHETGELVNLMVEKNGVGIYLHQAKGDNAVQLDTYEGKQVSLHCTALGKAILAFRPREEVEAYIDEYGLPQVTEHTITDHDEFFDELDRVRDRNYATDSEERLTGLRCIAAPITDGQDRSIAAVSVSCPAHRVSDERFEGELPDAALATANVIELEHNYS